VLIEPQLLNGHLSLYGVIPTFHLIINASQSGVFQVAALSARHSWSKPVPQPLQQGKILAFNWGPHNFVARCWGQV